VQDPEVHQTAEKNSASWSLEQFLYMVQRPNGVQMRSHSFDAFVLVRIYVVSEQELDWHPRRPYFPTLNKINSSQDLLKQINRTAAGQ
jgi:hypothetical protein